MRGSEKDKKVYYTWFEFDNDCVDLARQIRDSGYSPTNILGVRRGGVALAVRLASLLGVPITNGPTLFTLVVDDIVDSGETRDRYGWMHFASIHIKPWASMKPNFYLHTTEDWIVYPWEEEAKFEY